MKDFKKQLNEVPKQDINAKAAGIIASRILLLQGLFASLMAKNTASWGKPQQRIFLSIFFAIFCSLSVFAIVWPFLANEQKNVEKPTGITAPRDSRSNLRMVIITDKEFAQVKLFRHELDSIFKTKNGNSNVKQFLKNRPGLYDSLYLIEQQYYSQQNIDHGKQNTIPPIP